MGSLGWRPNGQGHITCTQARQGSAAKRSGRRSSANADHTSTLDGSVEDVIRVRGAASTTWQPRPHHSAHSLVVFTGGQWSGKCSLAFDTIFAEGQRRYGPKVCPPNARQFPLARVDKADVDAS